ncbi:SelB domain-containing protein [Enterobacter ludwigii]|uniref:SelB domain-containing protein n=1 Tax=Enterobacter ludwigii TaxID=299767 RepID=UPI0039763F8A
MDDRLFISADHYESLLADIFRHCRAGDLISIADVREYTGLARKQLIPQLNRMERDGWLRLEGNLRRVKRSGSEVSVTK